jgi:hypothetical protein
MCNEPIDHNPQTKEESYCHDCLERLRIQNEGTAPEDDPAEDEEHEPCECCEYDDCEECYERDIAGREPDYDRDDYDYGPTPEDIAWGDGQAADMVYGKDSPY